MKSDMHLRHGACSHAQLRREEITEPSRRFEVDEEIVNHG